MPALKYCVSNLSELPELCGSTFLETRVSVPPSRPVCPSGTCTLDLALRASGSRVRARDDVCVELVRDSRIGLAAPKRLVSVLSLSFFFPSRSRDLIDLLFSLCLFSFDFKARASVPPLRLCFFARDILTAVA